MTALLKRDNYPWALVGSSLLFASVTSVVHIIISLYLSPPEKIIIAIFMALMTCMPLFFVCIILYSAYISLLHSFFSDILLSSQKKHHLLLLLITSILFCGIGNYIANKMNAHILLVNANQMSYFYIQILISCIFAIIYFIKNLHKPIVFRISKKESELLEKLNKDNKNSQ